MDSVPVYALWSMLYTELAAGVPGIVIEDLTEIRREESHSEYEYQEGQWIMTQIFTTFRKNVYFLNSLLAKLLLILNLH